MTIAVDTRYLENNQLDGYGDFLSGVLQRVAQQNPDHKYIYIFDRPYDTNILFDKNITAVVSGPPASNALLWKFWYDVKIPALLRKYKVDVFIACNGICSLATKTPQCLVINDLSFLYPHSFIKKTDVFFLKRYTKSFLKRAGSIVTASGYLKKEVISQYGIEDKKITVVPVASKEILYQLNVTEKEAVKRRYTGGKNYFIYAGAIHPRKNIINLLKAFSVFKKRQKSDWKLVLAGELAKGHKRFSENLKTYKYRDDIVMTGYVDDGDRIKLIESAYAFIYPSFWGGSGLQIIEAMNSHTPVITSVNSAMQEMAGDAALYFDPKDYKDIADKMMFLYKDEALRNNLIEKGKILTAQYNWEKTGELFWQSILKAIK
ncbi:MAG: glycosyltransferase family 4 protein [Chitinophagaceae bacterium]